MFEKAERLSQKYYHENKVGTVMAWFTNDLETIEEYFGWGTIMLVDAIFMSVLVVIKMVDLDWALSLLTGIPVLLIIVWGGLVEKFMANKWDERQKAFDSLYDFTQENFTGIRVIKAFVKENQEIHAFAKIARKNKDTNISFVKTNVIFSVFIEVIIVTILCLLLGFGGYFVYSAVGETPVVLFGKSVLMTPDLLVKFVSYFDYLIWPLIAMGQIVSMSSRAKSRAGLFFLLYFSRLGFTTTSGRS
jgi:ATP-binding cassette subfamily B protein